MLGVLFLFICALCVLLLGICCVAALRIEELQREADTRDHAKCMSMVAAFIGDEYAAKVLKAAAHDFTTAEGQARLAHVRWNVWSEGQSMPALWMEDRAETILSKTYTGQVTIDD